MRRHDDITFAGYKAHVSSFGGSLLIGGIDLGGTKIEARVFDDSLAEIGRNRVPTPISSYAALVDALALQIEWLTGHGPMQAIGLGTPGVINPQSGVMLTANLPATGQRLGRDLSKRAGRPIALVKDCRAAALAEAFAGAGQGARSVVGLTIGTGVAGAQVINGHLVPDRNGQGGEFGHLPLPAGFVARHGLPLISCGCGLMGCFETYLAGPGLSRIARHVTGRDVSPEEIMAASDFASVRDIWISLAAELVAIIARTADPERIVLSGGLGMLPGLPKKIRAATEGLLLAGTVAPDLVQAHHGDASGALGAALFARQLLEGEV